MSDKKPALPDFPPGSDGLGILDGRYFTNPERRARVAARVAELEEEQTVARQLYELRTAAGLTQEDLASLVGTQKTAISRLERADYTGHSLAMLRRIAAALGKRVVIQFEDREPSETTA